MSTSPEQILTETEAFVSEFIPKNVPDKFVFHDLEHTVQCVAAARSIGEGFELKDADMALVLIATWFHDTGYGLGPEGHEERSCQIATEFLQGKLSAAELEKVLGCIRATRVPQSPKSLLEQIICDADLSHLGLETYWDRNSKFRHELILTQQRVMNEVEWVDFEINFMLGHDYHTAIAQEMFNKRKAKHIQQLVKQKRRLRPNDGLTMQELAHIPEKDKNTDMKTVMKDAEKDLKLARMGRGVETMYRTTYRTHTNLSAMADSKANLMLSVNAIVISILVSNLIPRLSENKQLIWPTIALLATCLGSMIYATLATRPKVTEGRVTREDIKKRQANLLFFGNFYNMKLEEFQWGVNEMLKDSDFLYSSMSRDLYFLGIVLAKKYTYLSICYNIFMYGLIVSVLAFAVAFVM